MPRGRPPKYPWDFWTNGDRHVLHQSEDWQRGDIDKFPSTVKVSSFRAQCHAAATRKGGKADCRVMGNTVHFRFIEGD